MPAIDRAHRTLPTPTKLEDHVKPVLRASTYSANLTYLAGLYLLWKACILSIVAFSPGPGYDTSTSIIISQDNLILHSWLNDMVLRLTRWDAIYFAISSAQGYVYEQQWAFSWAFTRLCSSMSDVLPLPSTLAFIAKHSLAGSIITLSAHLGAVVLVYCLTDFILPSAVTRRREIAFTTAILHIISPAGVFLIAPYSEAAYAFLSIAGTLLYARAIRQRATGQLIGDALYTITAGVLWGMACTMRGNGLLNGIVFAWDLMGMAFAFLLGDRSLQQLARMVATTIAGSFTAAGYVLPQYVAYQEFCMPFATRPWCNKTVPSIYSWVQQHYWEVGFLKYWTLSNLPLFLLAAPMIVLLLTTGYGALHHSRSILLSINGEELPSRRNDPVYQTDKLVYKHILERMAVPQITLAILALTSFHVQIINRISSGYPLWYMVLAVAIQEKSPKLVCGHSRSEHYFPFRHIGGHRTRYIVQGMVLYAVVQAGLYASFLPPA